MDREQRLQTTMAVGAVVMLLIGMGVGFSIGRFTAPKAVVPAQAPVAQTEATTPVVPAESTVTADTSASIDTSVTDLTGGSVASTPTSTTRPLTPRQLSPANGESVNTSRVTLRWSKVADASGGAVTYSFEIQDRQSGGTYGNAQTITGLKTNTYSARVLNVRRRWRVWAVDSSGNASRKSVWHSFIRTVVIPKKSADTSSTTSTTTGH